MTMGLLFLGAVIVTSAQCVGAVTEAQPVLEQLMGTGKVNDVEALVSLMSDRALATVARGGGDVRQKTSNLLVSYRDLFQELEALEPTSWNHRSNMSSSNAAQMLQMNRALRYSVGAQGAFSAVLLNRGQGWKVDQVTLRRGVVLLDLR